MTFSTEPIGATTLKDWLHQNNIKAWNRKTDRFDVQAWDHFWLSNRRGLEKSGTAHSMWKEWTNLLDIQGNIELKEWIQEKLQEEFYTIQYAENIEQFRHLWGDAWTLEHVAKSPVLNIFNDLYCLIEENNGVDIAFWIDHYSGKELADKIETLFVSHTNQEDTTYRTCMDIFHRITSEDYWENHFEKYYAMMDALLFKMESNPERWHPFLATQIYTPPHNISLLECPVLNDEQKLRWSKMLQTIPEEYIPTTLRWPSFLEKVSVPIESLYMQRISSRFTPEDCVRFGLGKSIYDQEWITACLEYIDNNDIPAIAWTYWICEQEKTITQWSTKQKDLAQKISMRYEDFHQSLDSYRIVSSKFSDTTIAHESLVSTMLSPLTIFRMWHVAREYSNAEIAESPVFYFPKKKQYSTNNAFATLKSWYVAYHAKEPMVWDKKTCKKFLLTLLYSSEESSDEEIEKIDLLFDIHDHPQSVHDVWKNLYNYSIKDELTIGDL